MKNSFSLFIPLFLIGSINAMEQKQNFQLKNKYDPYDYLFDKKEDKKKKTVDYVLKPERVYFRNLLPVIGKFVKPEYKEQFVELNYKMQKWLLTQLLFVNNCNKQFHPQLEKPQQLKLNSFFVHEILGLTNLSKDFVIKLNYFNKLKLRKTTPVVSLSKNIDGFPLPLIKAHIYFEKKIHRLHKEFLNNIYEKGIKKKKIYQLDQFEVKHFKLLPESFQKALEPHVEKK